MSKSNFITDSKFERASIEYLKVKYPFDKIGISNIRWTDTKDEQLSGSDMVATVYNNDVLVENCVIDVKSVASPLPTFSQEIINCKSGKVGWIMNNSLKTDYFLFVWHNTGINNYTDAKKTIAEDYTKIISTDITLVSKKALQDFIKEQTNIECNEDKAKSLLLLTRGIARTSDTAYFKIEGKSLYGVKEKPLSRIYITRSDRIHEQPLNFIVRKSDLENLGISYHIAE